MCVCVCAWDIYAYMSVTLTWGGCQTYTVYACDVQKLYKEESNFYHRSNPGLIGRNTQAEEEKLISIIIIIIIIIIITTTTGRGY